MWFLVLFCFSCSTICFFGKRNQSNKKSSKLMPVKVQIYNKNWVQNIQAEHSRLNVVLMCFTLSGMKPKVASLRVFSDISSYSGVSKMSFRKWITAVLLNWVEQYFNEITFDGRRKKTSHICWKSYIIKIIY